MEDFLKENYDPVRWNQSADYLVALLAQADLEDESDTATQELRQVFKKINNHYDYNWDMNRRIYVFARLDAEALIALRAQGMASWQQAFNAKAAYSSAGDLRAIHDAAVAANANLNLSDALTWASRTIELISGQIKTPGNLETAEQILKWGASPNNNSGGDYAVAVRDCGYAMGRLFALHGMNPDFMQKKLYDARGTAYHKDLVALYRAYGLAYVADPEILVEKKELDSSGNDWLKITFNFAAQRVTEAYSFRNSPASLTQSFSFDDYGQPAIEAARIKLIEMGGKPSAASRTRPIISQKQRQTPGLGPS